MIKAIALSGPSGVGKNLVLKHMLRTMGKLVYVPSFTTRKPTRHEDKEGVNYYFVSDNEFQDKIAEGDFIEYNNHYGSWYGIDRLKFETAVEKGRIPIKDIDVEGALKLKKLFGDECITIYLAPPSYEVLQDRLFGREGDSEEEKSLRLARYEYEQMESSKFDHIVVNDHLMDTIKEMNSIVYSLRR